MRERTLRRPAEISSARAHSCRFEDAADGRVRIPKVAAQGVAEAVSPAAGVGDVHLERSRGCKPGLRSWGKRVFDQTAGFQVVPGTHENAGDFLGRARGEANGL